AGREIWLWDAATGKELRRWSSLKFSLAIMLAFSPDSRLLVVGDRSPKPGDTKLRLLDVTTGEAVSELDGHAGRPRAVSFTRDGKILASGGDDKAVRLWDVATGKELRRLEGHQKEVAAVAFAPDGKFLASGSSDETIRLWDPTSGEELGRLT